MIITPNTDIQINANNTDNFIFMFHDLPTKSLIKTTTDHTVEDNFGMFVKSAPLPTITNGEMKLGFGPNYISTWESKIQFSPLLITFTADADLENYLSIWYWIMLKADPNSFGQALEASQLKTTASLIILNNSNQKVREFIFYDLHPMDLNELDLNYQSNEQNEVSCTFAFTNFLPTDYFNIVSAL